MSRAADYTIQGFLYQFNKTLLEILCSTDDCPITIEGIIEDIDIQTASGIKAIQCKYHEAQQNFTLSLVYKPILQMMHHFHNNGHMDVQYVLYVYCPNEEPHKYSLKKQEIAAVLKSKNQDLEKYTKQLAGAVDTDKFLKHFSVEFGQSLDNLTKDVYAALKNGGIPEIDIETLAYPNAIHAMATISIKHDEQHRRITKSQLLDDLQKIRKTAISRWTLALKSRKKIMAARQKQLKANLDKNVRTRYFLVEPSSIEDFDSNIILFITSFLDKYHFKQTHLKTPLFCLDCDPTKFDDIRFRLHQKGINVADGFVGSHFDKGRFFREPMSRKVAAGQIEKEFRMRLLRYDSNEEILNQYKCDDLFIIGDCQYDGLDLTDVDVEHVEAHSFVEIKYLLGVSNVYE
ncbi:hypothetical protein [Desulfomonile tiedjei]|uniref:Uncharacterized protein n=1 Tax=Desulfomonile tiedjei (strain ATCC 49306 / DSM 6799 / DCB-1) TaxID=706587 RepID=I4C1A0_DESTA|nr:hypothetical protein [Desulfomonile tiedjei]AFM23341.1 hypothetical protein Desti_0613 [Desulfomonile tiedjei DSM 6799]